MTARQCPLSGPSVPIYEQRGLEPEISMAPLRPLLCVFFHQRLWAAAPRLTQAASHCLLTPIRFPPSWGQISPLT